MSILISPRICIHNICYKNSFLKIFLLDFFIRPPRKLEMCRIRFNHVRDHDRCRNVRCPPPSAVASLLPFPDKSTINSRICRIVILHTSSGVISGSSFRNSRNARYFPQGSPSSRAAAAPSELAEWQYTLP